MILWLYRVSRLWLTFYQHLNHYIMNICMNNCDMPDIIFNDDNEFNYHTRTETVHRLPLSVSDNLNVICNVYN